MSVIDIKIPSPGESITEVEIGSWLKSDGDLCKLMKLFVRLSLTKPLCL
ncbi:MAG: hypothetical protein Ct9H300mP28_19560 [Pseudomonadota bacterium]|nr:MAG: hypothetical protein Ct9H300mP28_19560 [Pseudomonadota bacterium]